MDKVTVQNDIRTLSKEDLETFVVQECRQPRYRAAQVWQWLWQKGAKDFDDMSNLPKSFRGELVKHFELRSIRVDKMQKSSDGTIKFRFRLFDDQLIESVLIPMPSEKRYTVCVSSQVGCSLSCKFCATGQMDRVRNLTAAEIYDQVFQVNQQSQENYGRPITNIVYMGMGEPLLAYRPVMESIAKITSPEGLGMSPRRITVSTAGIAKMIYKLAEDKVRFNLALSLHAADDQKRNEIMPINEQNNLSSLKSALLEFYLKTRNKITLEYIAFQNFNDGEADAKTLAEFCGGLPVMVNIIEYNRVEGVQFAKSNEDRLDRFATTLSKLGVAVTVRRSRGKDIDAACGQLANKD
ncbi:MAG: 23S rRNA (adenine(2503)-C(2))-methyltransferase RlmN [Saprospiraceae bacterium]|nr:23S rRNA (adenine(2503)-C(2))-methyltransferase RlmN [Saprospiraceae bacterium]